jgi:hypothetical protein
MSSNKGSSASEFVAVPVWPNHVRHDNADNKSQTQPSPRQHENDTSNTNSNNEDDAPFTIGEKLEYFYLCLIEKQRKNFPEDCDLAQLTDHALDFDLSLPHSELFYLAQAIALIEQHWESSRRSAVEWKGTASGTVTMEEEEAVVAEIVKDVRRKASQQIRVPFIETLNTLITSVDTSEGTCISTPR